MTEAVPKLGDICEFREMRLKGSGYLESDFIPLGPCDVDDLLETVTVKRIWDGEKWQRCPN